MLKLHKWSRPRFRSSSTASEVPLCLNCGLQPSLYVQRVEADGKVIYSGLVVDDGRVMGSHFHDRRPRAGMFCRKAPKGKLASDVPMGIISSLDARGISPRMRSPKNRVQRNGRPSWVGKSRLSD